MVSLQVVARAMLALLAVFGEDRREELAQQKAEQLERIAYQVASAVELAVEQKRWGGSSRELLAFQLTMGWHETRYALRIGAGDCEEWECDPFYQRAGKRISAKARLLGPYQVIWQAAGYWQLHREAVGGEANWLRVQKDEAYSATAAAWVITRQRGACRSFEAEGGDWVRMTFSSLAARGCKGSFRGIDDRVRDYRRLLGAKATGDGEDGDS